MSWTPAPEKSGPNVPGESPGLPGKAESWGGAPRICPRAPGIRRRAPGARCLQELTPRRCARYRSARRSPRNYQPPRQACGLVWSELDFLGLWEEGDEKGLPGLESCSLAKGKLGRSGAGGGRRALAA